ncbi:MAG TPA: carboxysome shell protein [Synechococcales bacterium UBA12195]|uniref:carboxysome assembly protein CsoS2 n=1 Tax=Synechococcus sp. Minos11 TaxID=221341 RepID=UPI00015257FA|nr:CsoS2 family carboxysome shell protein [Synechococcus sp. Minos11]MEC8608437.1 CsoS2 family carboxysome shell protein [Cyanobacteriota bacterium]RCL62571.1 MAG: carboxysome shell protein [Synechococcus sp. MED-G67]CAK27724.1 Carboxysome shell polypeptide, CsoS2 [Synechococcus sp. RCC307]HCA60541.1 carboxysome shell protein [Synechococcales bacterium UBA8647]HCV56711.1 carboxysome shell protein [Synechococcales bacterium UBA12195]
MATQSSREAALARRMALSSGGKTAEKRLSTSAGRVRTAAEARPSRTEAPAIPPRQASAAAPVAAAEISSHAPVRRSTPTRVANPSRELVLARREALSRRGKRADTSSDRNRAEAFHKEQAAAPAPAAAKKDCDCHKTRSDAPAAAAAPAPTSLSLDAKSAASKRATPRRAAQHNPSRSLVLARREAQSKRGKAATTSQSSGTAAVARQGNPDMSSRELALKVRELRSKSGAASKFGGKAAGAPTRPTGPNRHGAKQAAAADAHWKVGASETLSGQTVTGTQANRSPKTTGNEASTCRSITGTEYLGAEVFQAFCQGQPAAQQPAKVRVTSTSRGNAVTGNEVGRSEKVTGDEPGTCKAVTGTEYIGADQASAYCGGVTPSVAKVGRGVTAGGQAVSGVMVGRSEKVTGNESGSGLQLTGDQYIGSEAPIAGRGPTKVTSLNTLRGTGVTGTAVGRASRMTGNEAGSCRAITGDEYIGSQQYEGFCGTRPPAEAPKVGFSITNRNQVVSGTRTGRSAMVTGDEPGSCKAVTGTPYAGLEQSGEFCGARAVDSVRERTPVRNSNRMTGIQPGIGGAMTGAERGACEDVTGTPYVGADQQAANCASGRGADFPQALQGQSWQQFSVQSPAQAAMDERARTGQVTGSTYEQGGRITGPFDMAGGKVTGTEQFRFDRNDAAALQARVQAQAPVSMDEDQRPTSRVTGEGSGTKVTGDDWDRGSHVTGTEGASARRRNPSRVGPMNAMVMMQQKRNDEVPLPVSPVTGSSGNTDKGSLITVSGGARG